MMESMKVLERDVMPKETATDILLSSHVSAPMRKTCLDARSTYYFSATKRQPVEAKLARRYKSAKLSQLDKWFRRVNRQESKLRLAWISAMELPESTQKTKIKNSLLLLLSVVETQLVELQNEISDRESRCIQTANKFPDRHFHPHQKRCEASFWNALRELPQI